VLNFKKFTIHEFSRKGISPILRQAHEDGLVVITKNGIADGLVIGLSINAMRKLFGLLKKEKELPQEMKEIVQMFNILLEKLPAPK
jgi:hypothetical protein